MREFTIFKNNQGQGYICDSTNDIIDGLHIKPITLVHMKLEPGEKTDLRGFFIRELMYCGYYMKNDTPEMIFEIGKDENKYYYQSMYKISETKILSSYTHKRLRDWNYKKLKWK
jgi:hypothetical protein